jgi:protein-S-isoprenylcysteine O-methyltransferase Ste14
MKDKLLQQTKREYSPRQRLAALLVEGIFFLLLLPYVLATLAASLDSWLRLPRFVFGLVTPALGWLLIAGGWLLAIWAIYAQFTLGRGTPVPLMATQKLVVQPPYTYCRNPMALGAIVLYLGVSVLLASLSAVVLVLSGAVWLLAYIKRIEEKEMEARFGEEYVQYKQRTPFLIPHFGKHKYGKL